MSLHVNSMFLFSCNCLRNVLEKIDDLLLPCPSNPFITTVAFAVVIFGIISSSHIFSWHSNNDELYSCSVFGMIISNCGTSIFLWISEAMWYSFVDVVVEHFNVFL